MYKVDIIIMRTGYHAYDVISNLIKKNNPGRQIRFILYIFILLTAKFGYMIIGIVKYIFLTLCLGKEIFVFVERINQQILFLQNIPNAAKFGGATGNFNAHKVAYPNIDWKNFGTNFVEEILGLHHSFPTTQIEHYDHMAALFDTLKRINTIVIDLNRDMWTYVSMDYFKQKII